MKKVMFVFDRVMHYHQDLFVELEQRLKAHLVELHLCSGRETATSGGRVALNKNSIGNESTFQLNDYRAGGFTFRLATGYLKKVKELRPDVVVCPAHPGDIGHWGLVRLRKRLGFKLVAWQCGYEYNPGRLKKLLLRRFVPGFDFHLAYHSNARRYALDHGAADDQILVMHNTINEAKFKVTDKNEAREALLLRHPEIGDRRIVLYVGAVLLEKKIEQIFDAMNQLGRSDAVLLVVGDGSHLAALREIAANRNDVVFAGQVVEGVGIYFDAAEMYVLPGTGGLGINEAMAHSLPIISGYADGSADDLVVEGENGFRLREGTVEELSNRIDRILNDPAMATRMGTKSREWITGKFSFQRFLDRVEEVLVKQLER
jgi:glycosyltransferase involved in cell wall biosynthesis